MKQKFDKSYFTYRFNKGYTFDIKTKKAYQIENYKDGEFDFSKA